MKLIFAITLLLATTAPAHAHEGDDDEDAQLAPTDIVLERDLPASAHLGPAHVIIHKAGHLEGKPYVVEVSERCPVAGSTADEERVVDTTSACDVAAPTLTFDAATSRLSVLVRDARADGTCAPQAKRVVFELSSSCDAD